MAQVQARRGTSGLRFVSTFSGCGGACLGLEMAGFEPLWASEFVPPAREVYQLNHPGVHVDGRDIRTVTADDIMASTGLRPGELDVLEGSPPCRSFSTAGNNAGHGKRTREESWGQEKAYSDGIDQRTDDLFFEYARLLRVLQPRAFVAENVPGMLIGTAIGYFKLIMTELSSCGYRVLAATLDASMLGVPQARRRLIFMGFRNDLGIDPVFPSPLPYRYTIPEAIGDLVTGKIIAAVNVHRKRRGADNHLMLAYDNPDKPSATLVATTNGNLKNPSFYDRGILVAPPGCTEDFGSRPEWIRGVEPQHGSRYFAAARPRVDGSIEPRHYTISEAKRLASFPDDFKLIGTFKQQWERIGRAVPPVMYSHVGRQIARLLGARVIS